MKSDILEILGLVFILAMISVLVRPNSLGPQFITAAGEGLTAVIEFAVSA